VSKHLVQWLFRRRFQVALFVIIWLGFGLRIVNLGQLALAGDEGATFMSVRAIVLHGVPIFDTGLWEVRGFVYLYLVAPFLYLFGDNEFALRLPGTIIGTLTILTSYKLCQSLFNRRDIALIAAAIVAFHPWTVEFSRTARVYVLFQFWTVLFLYFFYWGFVQEKSKKYQLWLILVIVASTIDHIETLSLLLLFSFLPLVKPWKRLFSPSYLLACVTTVAGPVGYYFLRPRIFGGISVLRPPNVQAPSVSVNTLNKISLFAQSTFGSLRMLETYFAIAGPVMVSIVGVGSILLILFLVRLVMTKEKNDWALPATYLYWSLLVLLVFFSMVRDSGVSSATLAVGDDVKPRWVYHIFPLIIYVYSFTVVYLAIFASKFLNNKKIQLGIKIQTVIIPALLGAAVFAVVSPRETLQMVFRTYGDPLPDRVFMGTTIKNAFFIEPFFNFHPDYKTTSLYVAEHYQEGDAVLVTASPALHFLYLGDKITHRLGLIGARGAFVDSNNELRELRVNVPRISSVQSIFEVMAEYQRVWILHPYRSNASLSVRRWLQTQSERLVYQGRDGVSKVYLFDEATTRLYGHQGWNLFYAFQDVRLTAEGPGVQPFELQLDRRQEWVYDDRLFLGPSDIKANGIAFNDQLLFHPFSDELSTNIRVPIKDNRYTSVETLYALADGAVAAGSNGVEYSILISVDGGASWCVLLQKQVQRAEWQVARIDLQPYQNQDLLLWLIADPMGRYDYDWLLVTFRLVAS